MITAPTAIGRKFVTRACNVLVETETGPAITGGDLAPKGPTRITVLTDRETGAQIKLDDQMLDYIADSLITPAERKARRVQAHYDANPLPGVRIHIKARTGWCGATGMTMEGVYERDGQDAQDVLVSCAFDKAGDIDLSTLSITGDRGRKVA